MIEWVVGGGVVVGAALWGLWRVGRGVPPEQARQQFQQQREHLEADFFDRAAGSGKPRGLLWKECEWDDQIEFAREKRSGQLVAIAGVTISFEAIPGGDMEGLPAVGNLRAASAVFVHDGRRWQATGRAVFNLKPAEVLTHFAQQYERIS